MAQVQQVGQPIPQQTPVVGAPVVPGVQGAPGAPPQGPVGMAGAPVPYAPNSTYSMASLYVGDLHPEVTESTLFEKFSQSGPVLSIRVCRDNASRLSLGYAYVNFQQPADAERALDTMNYETINDRPMRIMWSQRDPAQRRANSGNIFIKNLDRVIDNKSIYDTFSLFGNILSCKVAMDETGASKGYGFVHFETESSAANAIEKVNGMLLAGKKVYVGKFQPRAQRAKELGSSVHKFTNVFVKNFGEHLNEESFEKLFSKFGKISSAFIRKNDDGVVSGFGFVAFEDPDAAVKCVEEMNDTILEGTDLKLSVCRAQKKSERAAELKRKYEAAKAERIQRYQGVNLYVKNIDEDTTDDSLKEQFASFGTITSAKIMVDENGRSKGFGFVCFEKPEEATNAVTEMNSKMVGTKPLYVALAQRKEDRRAQLASQYMQRLASLRMNANQQQAMANMYATPGQGGYFVPTQVPVQGRFPPQQQQMRGNGPRMFNNQQQMYMQYPMQQQAPQPPRGMYNARPMQQHPRQQYGMGGQRPGAPRPQQQQGAQPQGQQQQQHMGAPGNMQQMRGQQNGGPRGNMQKPFYSAPRQQQQQGQQQQQVPQQQQQQQQAPQPAQQPQSGLVIHGQEPLTSHMLAQAAPQEQKQLLGERIYALIEKMFPSHKDTGKITGMMLEIDNAELIMMLNDRDLFRSKVEEALSVLTTGAPAPANQ